MPAYSASFSRRSAGGVVLGQDLNRDERRLLEDSIGRRGENNADVRKTVAVLRTPRTEFRHDFQMRISGAENRDEVALQEAV
jgi:hypothetical protein